MFMSSTYVYYREVTLDEDVLNITTVDENESGAKKMMVMSDNVTSKTNHVSSSSSFQSENKANGKGMIKSKSLSSLNYDGDTDSLHAEEEAIKYENIKLKCSICDIEYSAYLELPSNKVKDIADGQVLRKKVRRKKKRDLMRNDTEDQDDDDDDDENNDYRKVNFEDYKDWAHRMEAFDPKAERKWTLEYQVNEELPRLSKIIIGRGHDNEFPELNNIHLFDDVKWYEKSDWRNNMLMLLKQTNSKIKSKYSLIPSNQTCLFCFTERQSKIQEALHNGQALYEHVSTVEEVKASKKPTVKNGNVRNRSITIQNDSRSKDFGKNINDKLRNASLGKTITKIIRARKNNYKCNDEDDEEFEIL